MIGSLYGPAADLRAARRAENLAFQKELHRIKILKQETRLANQKAKLEAKIGLRQQGKDIAEAAQAAQNQALLDPILATTQQDLIDTQARSSVVKALPWIIGAVVVIGGIAFLKRKKRSN